MDEDSGLNPPALKMRQEFDSLTYRQFGELAESGLLRHPAKMFRP